MSVFGMGLMSLLLLAPPGYGTPQKQNGPACVPGKVIGAGTASWYGRSLHGGQGANGKIFDMHAMTAAHRSLPFGTKIFVINRRNGKSVMVTVTDRGPYLKGRIIDVSMVAAIKLGFYRRGTAKVELRRCMKDSKMTR